MIEVLLRSDPKSSLLPRFVAVPNPNVGKIAKKLVANFLHTSPPSEDVH